MSCLVKSLAEFKMSGIVRMKNESGLLVNLEKNESNLFYIM